MEKRNLNREEFMGLIGKFTKAIEKKGRDFIEQCSDIRDFWHDSREDLSVRLPGKSAGIGYCILCGKVYHVTPQRDNFFISFDRKEYGPYCNVDSISEMNRLEDEKKTQDKTKD